MVNGVKWYELHGLSETASYGILEFINPTGVVIIGLTSNNALTQKSLTAEVLVNGRGFEESAYLEGFQNSTVDTAGYLIANQFSYQLINGGLP
ncbi:hypothetical protein [Acidilobus sp.]|uniref:hypothetical protein n=1 Tax=Acidilobus sp. TaxID=1872109 RepID=UPI003D07669B